MDLRLVRNVLFRPELRKSLWGIRNFPGSDWDHYSEESRAYRRHDQSSWDLLGFTSFYNAYRQKQWKSCESGRFFERLMNGGGDSLERMVNVANFLKSLIGIFLHALQKNL